MVITCQEACFLRAFANKVCQGQILSANFPVPQSTALPLVLELVDAAVPFGVAVVPLQAV